MIDLPLGRTAAMVPELAVNDLHLGRTLMMMKMMMMMVMMCIYIYNVKLHYTSL